MNINNAGLPKEVQKKDYSHPDMKKLFNDRKQIFSLIHELWEKWKLGEDIDDLLNKLNVLIEKYRNDLVTEKSRWQITFSDYMSGILKEKIIRATPSKVKIIGSRIILVILQVKDHIIRYTPDSSYPETPTERKIEITYPENSDRATYPQAISFAIVE